MARTTLNARAQRFADQFPDSPDVTKMQAARYGFSRGYRAHQRDVRSKMIEDRLELMRRFYFMVRRAGLWDEYRREKESGSLEFVRGIKTPSMKRNGS